MGRPLAGKSVLICQAELCCTEIPLQQLALKKSLNTDLALKHSVNDSTSWIAIYSSLSP